jgi:hypothetical protein
VRPASASVSLKLAADEQASSTSLCPDRQVIDVEIAGVRAACERYAPGTAIPITVRLLSTARLQ